MAVRILEVIAQANKALMPKGDISMKIRDGAHAFIDRQVGEISYWDAVRCEVDKQTTIPRLSCIDYSRVIATYPQLVEEDNAEVCIPIHIDIRENARLNTEKDMNGWLLAAIILTPAILFASWYLWKWFIHFNCPCK